MCEAVGAADPAVQAQQRLELFTAIAPSFPVAKAEDDAAVVTSDTAVKAADMSGKEAESPLAAIVSEDGKEIAACKRQKRLLLFVSVRPRSIGHSVQAQHACAGVASLHANGGRRV